MRSLFGAERDGNLPHGHQEQRHHTLPDGVEAVDASEEGEKRQGKCHLENGAGPGGGTGE